MYYDIDVDEVGLFCRHERLIKGWEIATPYMGEMVAT